MLDVDIDNYWGGTDPVFQCLIDKKRVMAFQKVIKRTIKRGDVVVDLGSGTGIMAFIAAKYGASKVYAIEANDCLYEMLKKNVSSGKYKDVIQVIHGDATKIVLPVKKVDMVICEMIATGLFDECQIQAMNNIQKYLKKDTKILPFKFENHIELVDANNSFYGHEILAIQYEYPWEKKWKATVLSSNFTYKIINFDKKNDGMINLKIKLKIKKDGIVNAVRFSNLSIFPDNSKLSETAAYCMPLIFPVDKFSVKKGESIDLKLKYQMCNGLGSLNLIF